MKDKELILKRNKKICELYLKGLYIVEISKKVGLSRQTISNIIKKEIPEDFDSVEKNFERNEKINIAFYKDRLSVDEICSKFNLSRPVIYSIINKNKSKYTKEIKSNYEKNIVISSHCKYVNIPNEVANDMGIKNKKDKVNLTYDSNTKKLTIQKK